MSSENACKQLETEGQLKMKPRLIWQWKWSCIYVNMEPLFMALSDIYCTTKMTFHFELCFLDSEKYKLISKKRRYTSI